MGTSWATNELVVSLFATCLWKCWQVRHHTDLL